MTARKEQGKPVEPWEDRLIPAVYQSPSGNRLSFIYESVSREITRRTAKFEFNGLNDAYIQDNGYGPRSYPLACRFVGREHDREATRFEAALIERGVGQLEHPMYGTLQVIPTGTITRRNDLVAAPNETVIEVTFSTTLAEVYPNNQPLAINEIESALDRFNANAPLEYANNTELATVAGRANAGANAVKAVNIASKDLAPLAGTVADTKRAFDAQVKNINQGIDQLVGAPLDLAAQIVALIQAPARALAGIESRLEGYARFVSSLFAQVPNLTPTETTFRTGDLCFQSAVSGGVIGSSTNEYRSRREALDVAIELGRQLDVITSYRETAVNERGYYDAGESWSSLQTAVAREQGRLVQLSFDLRTEREEVLTRDRHPLELCAEKYQSVTDETIDFFLSTNKLGGAAMMLIPKGERILWYA